MQRASGTRSWPEGVRGTSAVMCCVVGPLRARVSLEMVNFDGRAVGGAPSAICGAIDALYLRCH